MTSPVTLPLWLFVLILVFAAASFATNFLFPSVRWFLRRRMERTVDRLNARLQRPIRPFNLLRRYDLIQRLIYDPKVSDAVVAHARETGVREDVAFERARAHAREIVPAFSAFTYFGWGVRASRFLSGALFTVQVSHRDDGAVAQIPEDSTVVFVMNHRSNMDYVLVTHLVAERSTLSYAVGEWARVWPLAWMVRSMGAYFIRRRNSDPLYRRVLRRYVELSAGAGVTQAIFPEGGLSLDGTLSKPRTGILSYIMEARETSGRDIVFVPVALNYDRVLEDAVLVRAGQERSRRFKASIPRAAMAILRQMLRWITRRYRRFGAAAVAFGPPLSLAQNPDLADDPHRVAELLMARIADVMPVLPVPLLACVLLDGPAPREAVLTSAAALQARIAPDAVADADELAARLDMLIGRGLVEQRDGALHIDQTAGPLIGFYANTIRHLT